VVLSNKGTIVDVRRCPKFEKINRSKQRDGGEDTSNIITGFSSFDSVLLHPTSVVLTRAQVVLVAPSPFASSNNCGKNLHSPFSFQPLLFQPFAVFG
jgi:hypothetical protein